MRPTLAQSLLRHIQKEGFLHPGQRVAVAVSGGADSMALLRLLLELRDSLGIVLSIAHFNHKLRGRASDADERFVAALAEKFGLPLYIGHADVAARARREKTNMEDTARRARYAFFEKLVTEGIVDVVATAHSADDQAETVLSHILRGTGLTGLSGIHPHTPHAVRPLLGIRREHLRRYLRAKKQAWREDVTNKDISRLRARIRKKLLPLLEKHFQPHAVAHLATLAELAREDNSLLAALARQHCAKIARHEKDGIRVRLADLLGPGKEKREDTRGLDKTGKTPDALPGLATRVIRLVAEKIRSRPGQWNARHVHDVWKLARRGESGKLLQLPGGVDVRRDHDSLLFCKRPPTKATLRGGKTESPGFACTIHISPPETTVPVPQLGCVFRFRVIDWSSRRRDTITESRFALDRDRLREPLLLRNWQPGDRFRPAGRASAQKFKRLLSEQRVSAWLRAGWPVLTSGGVLAWARGFPAAAEFAADESTRTGIVISEEQL